MANEEFTFPTQEYPSDFELWLEPDGVIRIRTGMRVTELGAQDEVSALVSSSWPISPPGHRTDTCRSRAVRDVGRVAR